VAAKDCENLTLTRGNTMENNKIDKRNILNEEPFSYKITKDKKVFIYWNGKQVSILKENESEKFLTKIQNANLKESQLIMAKITGNFKHGNEKDNKK